MAGPIRISILANGRQARREADLTARAYSGVGRTLSKLGVAAGLGLLTAKAVGFAKASVDLEAKFSQTMSLIGAATKAPAGQLEKLNDLAIKLGADTAFSASEAADAMLELAKAGIDTKTIMGGGLAGTLQLAAAGGTDLGTAATIASNALNTFNLRGADMASVAAALAGGANASSASVESLGQALQQVGPGATNAGFSLQETVAALSAFDAAGVKGSDAGTSLKTMLSRLVPQTEKAASSMEQLGLDFVKGNGEFESLTNIADQLQKKLSGLTAAQRTTALAAIFGSDATRAATVLMKEGAGGIREYIKATNDQNAAQEMAEARMSGTAGALERLSGSVETAQLRIGQELAPAVQKTADYLAENMLPATERVIDGVQTLGDIVQPVVGTLAGLPGPVKEIGIQAGIAALVLPRLAGGVTSVTTAAGLNIARLKQLQAELTYTATRAQVVTATMGRLAGAAKATAGVGGMVLLAQSTGEANQSLRLLETAAGGALTGLAVGGPLGAAVGGLGGALYGLVTATSTSAVEMVEAEKATGAYADTLDETTGAVSRLTRARVYDRLMSNETTAAQVRDAVKLGASQRDVIGSVLGEQDARRRLNTLLSESEAKYARIKDRIGFEAASRRDGVQALRSNAAALRLLIPKINEEEAALKRDAAATRRKAQAVNTWQQALAGLPKDVRVRLRNLDYSPTLKQVKALGRQYKLTPKQVQTILKAVNVDRVQRDAKNTKRALEDVGKAKPNLNTFERLFKGHMGRVKSDATLGGLAVAKNLKAETGKARPNLQPFTQMFNAGLGPAKTAATPGGGQIGGNLKAGVIGGFAGTQSALAAAASAAVRGAIAAARAAAKIKSPSREMAYIGEMMGEGLARGMEKKKKRNRGAGGTLVKAILKDVGKGLDGLTRLIEKKTKEARGKAILGRLKDEYAGLRKIGQQLDKNDRRLEKAVSKHKQLVQESKAYAKNIKDSAVAYGSVIGLGMNQETGIVSTAGLLGDLANRAVQVERYATLVKQLKAAGLNKTTIQQLLDAGVEGGLATAEAIAAGGASAIGQINTLTSQIATTGGALGDKMAKTFFGAGVKAAAGVVRGLEKEQKQLDKVAERLALSLVRKVKEALGIKSPSRVFTDIGTRTVEGLAIGLDETYVRRAGSRLAGSLQQGFGQPALDAYMSSSATSGQPTMTIHLTADELSAIEQGRRITAKVDAYRAAGGRVRA